MVAEVEAVVEPHGGRIDLKINRMQMAAMVEAEETAVKAGVQ
jgi:hypothetical protein